MGEKEIIFVNEFWLLLSYFFFFIRNIVGIEILF